MNLLLRFATVVPLAPIIVYLIWWHNPYGFYFFALLAAFIGLWEYASIVLPKDHSREKAAIIVSGLLVSVLEFTRLGGFNALFAAPELPSTVVVLALILVALSLVFLLKPRDLTTAPQRLALSFFGVVYCGILFTYVAGLGTLDNNPAWVTMLLTISWFGDTGGYFAGRFLGGKLFANKLYPEVSPKKTWEGFLGGLAGSVLATFVAMWWYFPLLQPGHKNLSVLDCFLIAIPAGVIGVGGDLVESLFKRAYGVKDSGSILPGHGGMLDRVDAVLFAAPYVYFYGRYLFSPS
jgi:phosphatidate cytidylyltransferase